MYKLTNSSSIIRIEDNASIPMDESNRDYQAYLEWKQSNIPFPADPEPKPKLQPLSPAQVRLVLDQFGLLDSVESAVATGNKTLQIEWHNRISFERDNQLLLSMATALKITDKQLDQMFAIGITL